MSKSLKKRNNFHGHQGFVLLVTLVSPLRVKVSLKNQKVKKMVTVTAMLLLVTTVMMTPKLVLVKLK